MSYLKVQAHLQTLKTSRGSFTTIRFRKLTGNKITNEKDHVKSGIRWLMVCDFCKFEVDKLLS